MWVTKERDSLWLTETWRPLFSSPVLWFSHALKQNYSFFCQRCLFSVSLSPSTVGAPLTRYAYLRSEWIVIGARSGCVEVVVVVGKVMHCLLSHLSPARFKLSWDTTEKELRSFWESSSHHRRRHPAFLVARSCPSLSLRYNLSLYPAPPRHYT